MALKFRLTTAAFDKLDDDKKALYKEVDGSYELEVDGIEDASALRRARDREKGKREEVEAERDELRGRVEELNDEVTTLKAKKTGKDTDIERLEGQWKKKVDDAEADRDTKVAAKDKVIQKLMVEGAATRLAGEISNSPKVMQRHIMDRMTVDFDGDEPALVILDKTGQPSKLTLEELGKEFVADKDYSAIILGNRSRGSVTPGNNPNPGAGGNPGQSQETPNLAAMKPAELAAHIKAQKEAAE